MFRKENQPPDDHGPAKSMQTYTQYKSECNTDIRERASPSKKPRLLFKKPLPPNNHSNNYSTSCSDRGKATSITNSNIRPMAPKFPSPLSDRAINRSKQAIQRSTSPIKEESDSENCFKNPFTPSKGTGRSSSVITSLGDLGSYGDKDDTAPMQFGLQPGRSPSVVTSIGNHEQSGPPLASREARHVNFNRLESFYNRGQHKNYLDDRHTRNIDIRETQGREIPYQYPPASVQSRSIPKFQPPEPKRSNYIPTRDSAKAARYGRVPSSQIRIGIQEEKDFQVLETVSTEEPSYDDLDFVANPTYDSGKADDDDDNYSIYSDMTQVISQLSTITASQANYGASTISTVKEDVNDYQSGIDDDVSTYEYYTNLQYNMGDEVLTAHDGSDDPVTLPPELIQLGPMSIHGDNYQLVKDRAQYQLDEIRSQKILDKVPKATDDRTLSHRGKGMSEAEQKIFIEKGNKALVHSPNYTLLAATHIEEDKQIIGWARLNQLTVPRFTAGKSVFVRDLQFGNYRAYRVNDPHPVVAERVVPTEAAFRWRHYRDKQFQNDGKVSHNAGVVKGPKRNQPIKSRGKPNSEANLNTMNGQQIISHLLAEGHEELDSKLQEKIIDIIKAGLRQGCNPEDDPCHADKVQGTSLRQLLTLCHEHEGGKNFSAEQFAFLHGIVTGLKIAKGGFKNLDTDGILPSEAAKQPSSTGNPFLK